jgi:hypothetical protein
MLQEGKIMNEEEPDWDLFGTPTQGPIKTHGASFCAGTNCCIHNPSDHHMVTWPLIFNLSKLAMGERVCEHFCKHPDPDSWNFLSSRLPDYLKKTLGVHNCCGCCTPPVDEV